MTARSASSPASLALFESETVGGFLSTRALRRAQLGDATEEDAQAVFVLERDEDVGAALNLFARHRILSAPLVLRCTTLRWNRLS